VTKSSRLLPVPLTPGPPLPASSPPAAELDANELDFVGFVRHAVAELSRRSPTTDSSATELILTLNRAAMHITYDLESAVHRPRGWRWSGFRVLFVLWLVGDMDPSSAARITGMSRAAVSSVTKTLEAEGLIERKRHDNDGRSIVIGLTADGQSRIEEAFAEHNRREQYWASGLTGAEQRTLIGLLRKLIDQAASDYVRHRD
jgi:DNA-binding MarR family transcriptional regulator